MLVAYLFINVSHDYHTHTHWDLITAHVPSYLTDKVAQNQGYVTAKDDLATVRLKVQVVWNSWLERINWPCLPSLYLSYTARLTVLPVNSFYPALITRALWLKDCNGNIINSQRQSYNGRHDTSVSPVYSEQNETPFHQHESVWANHQWGQIILCEVLSQLFCLNYLHHHTIFFNNNWNYSTPLTLALTT